MAKGRSAIVSFLRHERVVEPRWHHEEALNNMLKLYFVTDGVATLTANKKSSRIIPGQIALIGPVGNFSLENASETDALQFSTATFALIDSESRQTEAIDFPTVVIHRVSDYGIFLETFRSLEQFMERAHFPVFKPLQHSCLQLILTRLFLEMRQKEDSASPQQHQLAAQAASDAIDSNPTRRFSLEELARIAALSKTHFIRVFKAVNGQTPHQYQIRARCAHARELLSQGQSVNAVAYQCGYPDPFVFSKQFKNVYGFAPSLCSRQTNGTAR